MSESFITVVTAIGGVVVAIIILRNLADYVGGLREVFGPPSDVDLLLHAEKQRLAAGATYDESHVRYAVVNTEQNLFLVLSRLTVLNGHARAIKWLLAGILVVLIVTLRAG